MGSLARLATSHHPSEVSECKDARLGSSGWALLWASSPAWPEVPGLRAPPDWIHQAEEQSCSR